MGYDVSLVKCESYEESRVRAALIEALALNLADNADAKLETMTEILKGAGDNNGWLGFNRFMDSNVRKTTEF